MVDHSRIFSERFEDVSKPPEGYLKKLLSLDQLPKRSPIVASKVPSDLREGFLSEFEFGAAKHVCKLKAIIPGC